MKKPVFKIQGKVWLYPGMAAWHFVNVSKKASKEIKDGYLFMGRRGFGSVPVIVTIADTTWKTSIFPSKKLGLYILPLKKEVRKNENIKEGAVISYSIEIIM